MEFQWSETKNKQLKQLRGVSFEDLLDAEYLGMQSHPTRSNQHIMLFYYLNYVWVVPCVVEKNYIFLKTLFQSRKYTKKYEKGDLT